MGIESGSMYVKPSSSIELILQHTNKNMQSIQILKKNKVVRAWETKLVKPSFSYGELRLWWV